MKVENLMIGDYVLYNGIPMKVYAISMPMPDSNEHFNNKERVTLWCNGLIDATTDDIKPITITEEMLRANGFKEREQRHCYVKGKLYVKWLDKISMVLIEGIVIQSQLNYTSKHICTWHTLQHVFRVLTDEYLGFEL
jgi:hypothetical protein